VMSAAPVVGHPRPTWWQVVARGAARAVDSVAWRGKIGPVAVPQRLGLRYSCLRGCGSLDGRAWMVGPVIGAVGRGGGRRATVRQWQGRARALTGEGGGGAFWSLSAVGVCVCVAVGSGRPDTPFRGPHWPRTIPHRRRHAHPAAAAIFPPAAPVSTTDTIPHPSH